MFDMGVPNLPSEQINELYKNYMVMKLSTTNTTGARAGAAPQTTAIPFHSNHNHSLKVHLFINSTSYQCHNQIWEANIFFF